MTPQALSHALRTQLQAPVMWSLLEPFECGWLDGGCLPLAQALIVWLGSEAELWTVRDGSGRAQHVLARLGDWYLDGDGISSATVLLSRWRRLERIVSPRLTPFVSSEASVAGVFSSPALAAKTLAALRTWRDGADFARALQEAN